MLITASQGLAATSTASSIDMLNRYVQRGAICWSLARKIETDGWHEALIADLGDFIDDELADDIVGDIAGRLLDPTGLAALACGSALPSGRSAPWVEESLPSSSLGPTQITRGTNEMR